MRVEGHLRVLIVDDHPVMMDGLVAAIESDDQMVVAGRAMDGAQAIVQYRQSHPDVTLIDLEMRGVDSLNAITAILEDDPSACILVMTSWVSDPRIGQALALGAEAYLLKTVTRVEILAAIRSLANRYT